MSISFTWTMRGSLWLQIVICNGVNYELYKYSFRCGIRYLNGIDDRLCHDWTQRAYAGILWFHLGAYDHRCRRCATRLSMEHLIRCICGDCHRLFIRTFNGAYRRWCIWCHRHPYRLWAQKAVVCISIANLSCHCIDVGSGRAVLGICVGDELRSRTDVDVIRGTVRRNYA